MKRSSSQALRKIIPLLFFAMAGFCGAGWFDWDSRKIVIVQGTTSLVAPSEKILAVRLAAQIDAWLTETGTPHTLLTDDEVSPWRLWRTRVVILPYNPHPSPSELKALQSVLRAGGILVVCYGMDTALASLMEVRLGPYQSSQTNTQWASFEFDRTTMPDFPARVFQSSQHLVPVFPNSGTAHVIATWQDSRGTRTPDTAWIQSKGGFWMSHILQPGDDENKRQLLLAMVATVLPDIWTQAAKHHFSLKRPFGEYASLKAACRALGHDLPPGFRPEPNGKAYRDAQAWLEELTTLYSRRNLTNTFNLRGVWLDAGACPTPAAWPAIEESLQHQDLNTIFLYVGNPLSLRRSSQLLPPSALTTREAGQTNTPVLHAWLRCMNLEGAPSAQLKDLRDQNRLQVSDAGDSLDWLCPSHPENQALLAETASHLAQDKAFKGVHLDYIRYVNVHSCFCQGCRQRFEQALGHPLTRWPEVARTGSLARSYQIWRAGQLSACVDAISRAVHTVNPGFQVSAAVYGSTPACFASVGQDWPDWLRRDAVDFVCPMNYTSDLKSFQTLLKSQAALDFTSRIYPGVGLASTQSRLLPDQAAAQLILTQKTGFPGFVLFEYHQGMIKRSLPYLPVNSPDSESRIQNPE